MPRGIVSRGDVQAASGSQLKIGDAQITEAELEGIDGLTVTGAELNAAAALVAATTATGAEINQAADLSVNLGLMRVKVIPITANFDNTEQDTGWDLPAKAVVYDVFVDVTTADATETLDVGLKAGESGGDADGFLDGISVNAVGVQRPGVALDGGSAFFDTTLRGLFLRHFVQGAGADDRGLYAEKPHLSQSVTAKSVVYTGSHATANTMRGSIVIVYAEIA